MTDMFLPLLTLSGCVIPFHFASPLAMTTADIFPSFPIIRKWVFIFHEQHNHGWDIPTTFNAQRVRIPRILSWSIMAYMFLPFLFIRKCVFIFRELDVDHHGLHVPAIYDYQEVRINISWAAPWLWLTCSWPFPLLGSMHLYFTGSEIMTDMFLPLSTLRKCVIIPVSFATPSRLICSRHFRLLESAYLSSMSSTIMVDMFLPLLTLSGCVFTFRELDWNFNAYMFMQFLIIRKCVFIFHEQHNRGWYVPATFNLQQVCIPISCARPSWLTCSCHRWLSGSVYLYFMSSTIMADMFLPLLTLSGCVFPFRVSCTGPSSWLTCSCHFWLSGSAYLYFMTSTMITADMFTTFPIIRKWVFMFHEQHNHGWHYWLSAGAYSHLVCWTIMADMFPSFSMIRKCVFIFHEQYNHGWHVPATFDSQRVRNPIPWAAPWLCLTCSCHSNHQKVRIYISWAA